MKVDVPAVFGALATLIQEASDLMDDIYDEDDFSEVYLRDDEEFARP